METIKLHVKVDDEKQKKDSNYEQRTPQVLHVKRIKNTCSFVVTKATRNVTCAAYLSFQQALHKVESRSNFIMLHRLRLLIH